MNLQLCKFPRAHLTRFRLVQRQSATVTAHTCALSTLTTLFHLEPLLHLGSFITFEASIQQRTVAQLILQNVAYCCMPSRLKSLIT